MSYWNVVDAAEPTKYLMPVSTSNYVLASNRANELRREYPEREFNVVRCSSLEPYKEVG